MKGMGNGAEGGGERRDEVRGGKRKADERAKWADLDL
jgi:hypothetical protein